MVLASDLVGRYHALRDVLEPTLLFAERLPKVPQSWMDERVVRRAADFLEGQRLVTSREMADLDARAKQAAFTMAGETRKTALGIARDTLAAELRRGATPAEATSALTQKMLDAGYSAMKASHAEFVTNQVWSTAYGAASWEALHQPRIAPLIPWFMYLTRRDARVRPVHRAMDGRIFERDDPIWDRWWPPNDWGCRCRVTGVTVNTIRTYGLELSDRPPQWAGEPGSKERVRPAPGFDGNPSEALRRMARRARRKAA